MTTYKYKHHVEHKKKLHNTAMVNYNNKKTGTLYYAATTNGSTIPENRNMLRCLNMNNEHFGTQHFIVTTLD